MRPTVLGQVIAGIIILTMILVVPLVSVFCGWSEWQRKIRKGELALWLRIAASVGIVIITAQTILFISVLGAIIRYKVLDPYSEILFRCVIAELVMGLFAAPCTFAWRGRTKWWLLASSFYLPVISFFSVLGVLAY
jgi:hypothetical protein